MDPIHGDYWSGQVVLASRAPATATSAWGTQGTYVYRFEIRNPNVGAVDWIGDPFAREFGIGKLSAITLDYQPHAWAASELAWKTPHLRDLVIYELMLDEFADGIEGTIDRLDYLADLGINCLEIMPVSNVSMTVDWGFLPIGHFGVDERFGNRANMQRLVQAAHQHGIAVILDAVYGHTAGDFPYSELYRRLRYHENPFLGRLRQGHVRREHGLQRASSRGTSSTPSTITGSRPITSTAFATTACPTTGTGRWASATPTSSTTHIREVQDPRQRRSLAALLRRRRPQSHPVCRAARGARRRAARHADQLQLAERDLRRRGQRRACRARSADQSGFQTGARSDFPTEEDHGNGIVVQKTALQYIENHDHERFVNHFGIIGDENGLFREGDRSQWYKVQPYLIAMMCAKGIPLLWQGQEFGENYWIPNDGLARVMLFRPVRWDYFYDEVGKGTIGLVRRLTALRRGRRELRHGNYYFYNHDERYQFRGLLLFSREDAGRFTLVALNFSGSEQTVPFWFPIAGNYREQLHDRPEDVLNGVPAWGQRDLRVPGNYGRVWSNQ